MKPAPCLGYLIALATILGCAFPVDAAESGQPTNNVSLPQTAEELQGLLSPLGLPRLRKTILPDGPLPIEQEKFRALDLEKGASVGLMPTLEVHGRSRVAKLRRGGTWVHPLSETGLAVQFVSLLVYASKDTEVSIGGASLRVTSSPLKGALMLEIAETQDGVATWRGTGLHARMQTYGGEMLAAFPVLTVRTDSSAGEWDLYSGVQFICDGIRFLPNSKTNKDIRVSGGESGAWICGVVESQENPLYEDVDRNGIDDEFEKKRPNQGSDSMDSDNSRRAAAAAWREAQQGRRPPAMLVEAPAPDNK